MTDVYMFPRNVVGMVGQAEELFQRLTQEPRVRAHLEEKGKQAGGYVTIARAFDGQPLITLGLGNLLFEKVEGCHRLSLEKVQRAVSRSHRLSRMSADSAKEQYPGAVVGNELGASLSGLPADGDEVYSAALLCRFRDARIEDMAALLRQHGNTWIDQLVDFRSLATA